jgi:hypothetical protein
MPLRASVRVLCLLLAALSLASCSRLGLRSRAAACREPQIPASPGNNAALKVAPGLDLPDTRGAIRVPELTEPEKPRSKSDPCLSRPPAYGS